MGPGEFELISDYAQPYSVAVICTLLGVPVSDGPLLLDWSHAIVKMYELDVDARPSTGRRARGRPSSSTTSGRWSSNGGGTRRTT